MPRRVTTLGTCSGRRTRAATRRALAGRAVVMVDGEASAGAGARGGGAGGVWGGGGAWGGGGGGGGGGGSGMSDEQRQRMQQTMQLVFAAPTALTIAETDSSVAFALDGNAALVLRSDGRKVTQKVEGGGDVETRGRWQGNDFVVERKVAGGGEVTENYLRSQD